jgi:hypothetical protein
MYKSDFILNPRIVRFGSIEQALQKPVLKLESAPDLIPARMVTIVAGKTGSSTELLVVLPCSVE